MFRTPNSSARQQIKVLHVGLQGWSSQSIYLSDLELVTYSSELRLSLLQQNSCMIQRTHWGGELFNVRIGTASEFTEFLHWKLFNLNAHSLCRNLEGSKLGISRYKKSVLTYARGVATTAAEPTQECNRVGGSENLGYHA